MQFSACKPLVLPGIGGVYFHKKGTVPTGPAVHKFCACKRLAAFVPWNIKPVLPYGN